MQSLVTHDALLSALSRMLHEEGKKNIELATNVLTVFALISNCRELHSVIIGHRIGSKAISLLEFTIHQILPKKIGSPSGRSRAKSSHKSTKSDW